MLGTIILIVVGVLIVIFLLMWVGYYNKFIILSNRIKNSFSQIDVQLKKRADLVPNLMESVKGYMKHEAGIMKDVSDARKALVGANSSNDMGKRVKAGDALQSALGRLFAIAENYPNLKANENFLQFQNELSAIEDKVAYSRQFYNDSILGFDNAVQTFPGNLFAGQKFKSQAGKYIQIPEAERASPKVKF
ncbi:MAG: LemA family protein [Candidatus Pacearchaeota archaeon]|nr:LemA family protein [Candidatus Pacearchaeota archaeon]